MKNQEFKIDVDARVVVFSQKSHGKEFISTTKANTDDEFNIGIGQLIVMKKNEIEIRKADIKSMIKVSENCKKLAQENRYETAHKMYTYYAQLTDDKISRSRNHIIELKRDLKSLYEGTYDIKPYSEIVEMRKIARKGNNDEKSKVLKKPYAVPQEIIDRTHIFEIKDGGVVDIVEMYINGK